MIKSIALAILGAVAMCACENAVDAPSTTTLELTDDASAAVTFSLPTDVATDRLYLGVTNWVNVSTELPWHYGVFDLNPRGRILIELYEPTAFTDVGFKVYRVTEVGGLVHLGTIDGSGGYAGAYLSSRHGGSYVVESVSGAGADAATLALDVSCLRNDGNCSPNLQPGALCGTRGVSSSCDDGLYCAFAEACGATDSGGTCELPAQMCPAVVGVPVCGCDGNTYGSACDARSAGMSIAAEGPCACDDSVWGKSTGAPVDVVGTWTFAREFEGNDVVSTLVLNADGTFTYDQFWNPTCLRIAPYCRRASLMFSMTGTYENHGDGVQLYPTSENIPMELAQAFGIEVNCAGGVRLNTTEMGDDRTLLRDPCAATSCEEGQHCEMVQVQCITAPCPPLPSCVADAP